MVTHKLPTWLPPMLCPDCGANVYACEEQLNLDVQAPGRMPVCWSCAALLVVDASRYLRFPTPEEILDMVMSGSMPEMQRVLASMRQGNKVPVLRIRLGDPFPWVRSMS